MKDNIVSIVNYSVASLVTMSYRSLIFKYGRVCYALESKLKDYGENEVGISLRYYW